MAAHLDASHHECYLVPGGGSLAFELQALNFRVAGYTLIREEQLTDRSLSQSWSSDNTEPVIALYSFLDSALMMVFFLP